MRENKYDYIIAGGGMAGLSLAFYLNKSALRHKKILILDRAAKNANDHTWCFWQKERSPFEEIIFRKWNGVWFHGTQGFSRFLNLSDYEYKMIRAVDFYRFIREKLEENSNIAFLQTEISEIVSSPSTQPVVKTSAGDFTANELIFDSFTRKAYDNPRYQNLWQHFTGWTIETERECFDPAQPTLFDFRIAQKNECRFVYILPFSATGALIEFTVFSDNLLPTGEYENNLKNYINESLKIENYRIAEVETGVIPMSDELHNQSPQPSILRIGTAGGYVKPSTGYSFARTQRYLQEIVSNLENSRAPLVVKHSRWKTYLDSVLLNVLRTKKHPAADVFTHLFARNRTAQVLKFLDEETNFSEDLQIMKTVPLTPFTRAAIESAAKLI